jgi:hypothetical protein
MVECFVEVSEKGVVTRKPALSIEHWNVINTGRFCRIARLFDEDWIPGTISDPEKFISSIRNGSDADIFTFAEKLPNTAPRFSFAVDWENVAAIPITSYADWWNALSQETRRNVRKAEKGGLQIKVSDFSDDFVNGIKGIYDESPVRQGKRFWHFGKSFDTVKDENGTYRDRSIFIGAYSGAELVGFIKVVVVGNFGSIMQILSKAAFADKRPTNALIAKAVEVCAEKGLSHLVYCQYVYGKNTESPLTEFKRRNGFQQILLPRYYIPLTLKGKLMISSRLHLGVRRLIPFAVERRLLHLRNSVYGKIEKESRAKQVSQPPASLAEAEKT